MRVDAKTVIENPFAATRTQQGWKSKSDSAGASTSSVSAKTTSANGVQLTRSNDPGARPNRTDKPDKTEKADKPDKTSRDTIGLPIRPQDKLRLTGTDSTVRKTRLTTSDLANPQPTLTRSTSISDGEREKTLQPLTLDGLLKEWGQKGSIYDLTGNGTVDTDDLLAFINSMPTPEHKPQPSFTTAAVPPADGTGNPSDVSFTTSGGASGGSVGSTDEVVGGPSPTDIGPSTPPSASLPPSVAASSESESALPTDVFDGEPLTLNGLLQAWGQGGTHYDLNNDGTVNTDDLLTFINSLSATAGTSPSNAPGQGAADDSSLLTLAGSERKIAFGSLRSVQQLTESLIERLDDAGFQQQPPANIKEVVSRLELSTQQQQQVFKQLTEKYPQGLGVNVIG